MTSSLIQSLVGDSAIEKLFSDEADIRAMLAFEAGLAGAEADTGVISHESAQAIEAVCANFVPDMAALKAGMARDGVVVPSLVIALRKAIGDEHGKSLHLGATSQDAIDTSLVLRLKEACVDLDARLAQAMTALDNLKERSKVTTLMAHTRMQQAIPFTASDKIETWERPLKRHRMRLREMGPRLLVVQFGGPVGTRGELGGKGDAVAECLAERLNLGVAPAWHTARDTIVEFGGWLSLVSGALGKIGADVALMAQNEIGAVRLADGGRSSAMPHKSNPVVAEILVTLARFNATLVGGLHQSLVHENERSGSAWTLEWMVLPQMVIATAAGLNHVTALLDDMEFKPDSKG